MPSNFRHVSHVAFDRFNGFLGLPMEFKAEAPKRALSARSLHVLCQIVFFYNDLFLCNFVMIVVTIVVIES